jgi:hypothetical protein
LQNHMYTNLMVEVNVSGIIKDGSTGDIADDHYHRFEA